MSGKHGQTPRQKKGMASGLAVGLAAVLVTGGALALQVTPPDPTDPVVEEPTSVPLTSAALACPAALPDAADLTIGRAPGGDASSVEGSLEKRPSNRAKRSALKVGADAVTTVQAEQATVVSGTGSMAPGLFGARFGTEKAPAAGECVTPAGERWFPGLGAGGFHESRLLLANPDKGPAVVDLTIWSRTGPMRKVESRGLTIPASKSSEINLAELAPEREELAVQVTVSRGRVAVSTQDTYTPQGAEATTDWFPWTAPPANEQVIPGLPRKADENTLVLINPGADEGRVSLKVRGADSEFAPTGLSDIRVPAGRVVVTELTDKLKQAIAKEDTSLAITSTVPVAASLRTVVNGDLGQLAAVPPLEGSSSAVVAPSGEHRLVVSAAERAGVARLHFIGAEDKKSADQRTRLRPGVTTSVEVPPGARAVVVDADVPYVGSLRSVGDNGITSLPLRQLETERLIPDVRPSWP